MKKILRKVPVLFRAILRIVKLGFAWVILHGFYRDLIQRDIWLICEKRDEARDNGYHFYKYVRERHPEINAYYVITKGSADLSKVKMLGNIIFADSIQHAVYFLACVMSINSQAYGAFPYGMNKAELRIAKKMCNPRQKTIFLQHGIIKDELSHKAFDYASCNIDFFTCSVYREYEFVKEKYGYPDSAIGQVGLCRFDKLYHADSAKEKIILVMPTWRTWLKRHADNMPLKESEMKQFAESDYCRQYIDLLMSEPLRNRMKDHGYKLIFYPHYQLQDYLPLFSECADDTVIIADRGNYDVQELLMSASVLVTDYSSVQFDFAYMNKPVVYFQFDKKRFEGGHYKRGYFDYEVDAFGPCSDDVNEVVRILEKLIETDGVQPDIYQKRIDDFFDIRDDKNCERTFHAISRLQS